MPTVTAALFNKVHHAVRLRAIGAGAETFADQTWVYDSGTITSATDAGSGNVTIGDSTKTWTFLISGTPHMRWTEATPGSNGIADWDWGSYDLVIEAPDPDYTPDPRKVLQGFISAQPDATHVTVSMGLATRITEGRLAAVGDVVGRKYWILRAGGSNWTRGYFDQPNDPAVRFGRVQGVAVDTGAATTTLTSDRAITDVAVGQEVLYRDAGDVMRRQTVTGVDAAARTIVWAGTSDPPVVEVAPTPLREFYAVAAGAVWVWGASGGTANTAYAGLRGANYLAHGTDDEVTTASCPTLTYDFTYGQDAGTPAFPVPIEIFNRPEDGRDIDLWYPQDNAWGTRDTFVNARMHKSIRDWWSDLMGYCTRYVKPINYGGEAVIPEFSIATWLYYAGVNPHAGTAGTHTGTSMPCALGVPHTPITLWWSIVGADGAVLISGYEDGYDGSTLNGAFSAAHDGKAVYASTGPTRPVPKRFGRMFDVAYFEPAVDGDPAAAQTPSNTYPGTWRLRLKSTHYRMSDDDHVTSDSTLARHAIADGDYARLTGDNRDEPGFAALIPDSGDEPLGPYINRAYVGTRAKTTQSRIVASRSGTATAGGSTVRIVDASKNWLAVDFYPAFNGCTHAFTPASGSTTGCTVPGVSGTALWAAGRFETGGPMVGFTVEVITNGAALADPADFSDPLAVIEKRLIATGTTAGVLTWTEATSVSVAGKACRIREPAVLNRWRSNNVPYVADVEDHCVTVTHPDGTTATVAILGNHDDTLFVDTLPFPAVAGCSYAIHEPQMSGVFLRDSGQWVTTADAGADPRYTATGAVFRADARHNKEDMFYERGLYRPGDEPLTPVCLGEIVAAVNVLDMVKVTGTWIDTTANKRGPAAWHNVATSYADWSGPVVNGSSSEPSNTAYYLYNGPVNTTAAPRAKWLASAVWTWTGSAWVLSSGYTGSVERNFNHFQVTLPANVYPKSITFYDLAAPLGDFDPNDDAVANGLWTEWSTGGGTSGTVTSSQLGSLNVPNDTGAPPAPGVAGTTPGQSGTSSLERGYEVVDAIATCSYGFPALTI
jgi:hypothetical protein